MIRGNDAGLNWNNLTECQSVYLYIWDETRELGGKKDVLFGRLQ